MAVDEEASIFSRYFNPPAFSDRYAVDPGRAVDVIIPIIHTNELWRANLLSIYREIPVNRLILGDGGCIDGSIDIAREFPRLLVLDHRSFKSLGFSIRHLIEATSTEWFVYLHSDVLLPAGWFDAMSQHREKFDFFECNQRITVLADYLLDTTKVSRSYSGSQMGRKSAFETVTPQIDDDFLYRNEDIIFQALIERSGHRYGKVGETYHFHQLLHKPSRWRREIKRVNIEIETAPDEELRSHSTYVRGLVKYVNPNDLSSDVHDSVRVALLRLIELKHTAHNEFLDWVRSVNPAWVPVLQPPEAVSATSKTAADQIVRAANVYKLHGGRRLVVRVFSFLVRKIGERLRNVCERLHEYLRNGLLALRGGSRKLVAIVRQDGPLEAVRFVTRRVFRLK